MIERDEKATEAEGCLQLAGGGGVLIRSAGATLEMRPVRPYRVRQLSAPAAPVEPRTA